ncbi:putative endo-beta-1,4-glucanase D [Paramyrothecium foliicola]|nr:putative endo-beta-1,4-glucanase D [Paramyrothecium foliicola]
MLAPTDTNPSLDDNLHAAGSVFYVSSNGEIIKLPIPSNSPRDPLRWMASFQLTLPGVIACPVQLEFGDGPSSPVNTNSLSTIMNICTGFGYFIAIPLSTAIGRRPVFFGAATLTIASTLWAGLCGSFDQLRAAVAFQALAAGAAITMCILMVIDGTFIHERPNVLSLYWSLGSVFVKLAFVVLPFTMDLTTEWRPIYHFWLAPSIAALLIILFLLPETYFLRPPVAFDGRILIQTSSEKVLVYEEEELSGPVHIESTSRDVSFRPASRLGVTRAHGTKWKALGWTYMQMLYCIANPLTFWVAVLTGVNLSGVLLLSLTEFNVLVKKWGQDAETVSLLLGVTGIIGSILAFPATGPLMSWFTRRYAMYKGGVRQAEVYLFSFSIPVVSGFLSVLINGLAICKSWPPAWLYFASGLSLFSYISGNVAFTLWITEAFPRWAAAALCVQMFVGNLVSFGIGQGMVDHLNAKDIMGNTVLISVLILVLGFFAVPASIWDFFPKTIVNGVKSNDWQYVRETANNPQSGPVEDVSSTLMRCYEKPGRPAAAVQTVAAGSRFGFTSSASMGHPGPSLFYLARVPDGQDVNSWVPSGNVWFKIDQYGSTPSKDPPFDVNMQEIYTTIPSNLRPGNYLLRYEHIGLHIAGAPQFYIGCAQIKVTGSGSGSPSSLVSFPGAYSKNDAGLKFVIYGNTQSYPYPGPAVWK